MTFEEKRDEIMQLDRLLVDYFQKRMEAIKELAIMKRKFNNDSNDIDYENKKMRELLKNVDDEFKESTLMYIMNLLKISREYQSNFLS